MSINRFLVRQDPKRYGATAVYPYSETLAQKLTFVSRFGDKVELFSVASNHTELRLPRALCPKGDNDVRAEGVPVSIGHNIIPKNEEQENAIHASTELLKMDRSHVLQAATGAGKTVMAINVMCNIGVLTVVVVPKEDLIDQWIERLLTFTDLKRSDIGLMQQKTCEVIGKKVVIASLKSLTADGRYPAHLLSLFGLVIFDEVHRLAAETFSKACYLFPAKLRLGLSATTDRSDGKEDVFFAHIGPVMVKIDGIQLTPKVLMYRTGWRLPRVKVGNDIRQLPHGSGRTMHVTKIMAKNGPRNALIAMLAKAAFDKGRTHVIFSDIVSHLEYIEMALLQAGISLNHIGHYYGATKATKLKKEGQKRVILATYKKMAEGTDIPQLDTCTLATPRSDVRQPVGRILREMAGKKKPIVFDLLDDDSAVFRGYYERRRKMYEELYEVQPIAMAHRD